MASIHQPSTSTFNLFDKLLLLSNGKTQYFGPLPEAIPYFESIGGPIPVHVNPAEFLLEQLNVDFTTERTHALQRLQKMHELWAFSARAKQLSLTIASCQASAGHNGDELAELSTAAERKPSFPSLVMTLLHRSFIKSYRDVIAYGVRAVMYIGLALMMGTVWVRLGTGQEYIQPYINAIVSSVSPFI